MGTEAYTGFESQPRCHWLKQSKNRVIFRLLRIELARSINLIPVRVSAAPYTGTFKGKVNRMSLFIANTTKQVYELHFWVEGSKRPYVTIIRPGTQENVYPQGARQEHEHIIEQHTAYGLKAVNEIDRSKEFIGQCYQFDKPIPYDRLMSTYQRNDTVMNQQAQERRKEAAIAMDHILGKSAQENNMEMKNFEIGYKETEQRGVEKQIDETVIVENPARGRRARKN